MTLRFTTVVCLLLLLGLVAPTHAAGADRKRWELMFDAEFNSTAERGPDGRPVILFRYFGRAGEIVAFGVAGPLGENDGAQVPSPAGSLYMMYDAGDGWVRGQTEDVWCGSEHRLEKDGIIVFMATASDASPGQQMTILLGAATAVQNPYFQICMIMEGRVPVNGSVAYRLPVKDPRLPWHFEVRGDGFRPSFDFEYPPGHEYVKLGYGPMDPQYGYTIVQFDPSEPLVYTFRLSAWDRDTGGPYRLRRWAPIPLRLLEE